MTFLAINSPARRRSPAPSVLKYLSGIVSTWQQRQTLKSLDDQMLADIGLSYRLAKQEADKPIWDVPSHWRR